jgi:hypothetical protein
VGESQVNNTRARQCPRCKGPTVAKPHIVENVPSAPKWLTFLGWRSYCQKCCLYWVLALMLVALPAFGADKMNCVGHWDQLTRCENSEATCYVSTRGISCLPKSQPSPAPAKPRAKKFHFTPIPVRQAPEEKRGGWDE